MTRLVLVMHAPLGAALASCAQHVYGKKPDITVFDITPAEIPEAAVNRLSDILTHSQEGVLVLSDLMGATPFNIARAALKKAAKQGITAELVTGTNLGILLKALAGQHEDPAQLKEQIRLSALRDITSTGDTS